MQLKRQQQTTTLSSNNNNSDNRSIAQCCLAEWHKVGGEIGKFESNWIVVNRHWLLVGSA